MVHGKKWRSYLATAVVALFTLSATAQASDIKLDINTLCLSNINNNETINVIGKEFQLMELFIKNPNQIMNKEQIFNKIWGYDSDSEINTLEAYMSFIRKKLKNINSKVKIKVIRNIGYKLEYQNEKIKI